MSTATSTEGGYKSASFMFDSYAYVRRLREAGMDEQQAAIQAETFMALAEDRLATKQDIAELRRDIEATKAELQKDIAETHARIATVEANLKRDIALVEANLKRDIATLDGKIETAKESLRKEIEVAKSETIKWMVGLALAQLAMMASILMTLVRVLPGGH